MNWIRIASTDQLTDDDEVIPVAGDKQLALYRSEGEFYASDNVCTHAYALLSDATSKTAASMPAAPGPLRHPHRQGHVRARHHRHPRLPVKVEGQDIYADLQG